MHLIVIELFEEKDIQDFRYCIQEVINFIFKFNILWDKVLSITFYFRFLTVIEKQNATRVSFACDYSYQFFNLKKYSFYNLHVAIVTGNFLQSE